MNAKMFAVIGAVMGFVGVALGAFGAHALKARLEPEMLNIFEVGVRYHMFHALALFCSAWAVQQYGNSLTHFSGWFFVVGVLVFSGSLYLLAFTGIKKWGALTPIGGLFLLIGWLTLALGIWRHKGS